MLANTNQYYHANKPSRTSKLLSITIAVSPTAFIRAVFQSVPNWPTPETWSSFSIKTFLVFFTFSCNMPFLSTIKACCQIIFFFSTEFVWMLHRPTFIAISPALRKVLFFIFRLCMLIYTVCEHMASVPTFQASLLISFLFFLLN